MLLWPVFISRILYVQFHIVVPLALIGLNSRSDWRTIGILLALLPPIVSVALFLFAGHESIFDLLKRF